MSRAWRAVRRLASRAPHARLRLRPRLRVMLGVVTIVLAAPAAFDFAAVTLLRNDLLSATDGSLRTVLTVTEPRLTELLPSTVADPAPKTPAAETPSRPVSPPAAARSVLGQYSVAFMPPRGDPVILEVGFGAPQAPLAPSQLPALLNGRPGYAGTVTVAGEQTMLRALQVRGGVLVAGTALGPLETTVGQIERTIVLGSIALVLLIAAGVFLVLRRGFRPIKAMADQADQADRVTAGDTAGDLAERVSARHSGSEVGRRAAALNGMLGRIETSVHEREADQEAMRGFFDDASREPVDLTALVVDRVDRARAGDRDRRWMANVEPDLAVTGDEELLRRALDNLLSNVSTHTPVGTWTEVTAELVTSSPSGGGGGGREDSAGKEGEGSRSVRITVADNGRGVPAEALPRLFDRFLRAPATAARQPGSGLGLAIVAEAAAAHDGRVEAADNSPRGLRVVMSLPVRANPASAGSPAEDAEP